MNNKLRMKGNYPLYGCSNCKHSRDLGGKKEDKDILCGQVCSCKFNGKYDTIILYQGIKFKRNKNDWKYKNFELHPILQEQLDEMIFIKLDEFSI